ncbi:MAG: flagellar export protein FliJ [Acidobacteria bacterium]|nr:flagellar export protein FliJ [Acidobacteriota bacterium]
MKSRLKRLERLLQIRQTYVSVAETNVKQAEGEVRRFQQEGAEVDGQIQHQKAGIAYLETASGHDIQISEKYIFALQKQRDRIHQSLENAASNLEQRRREWTEAMREQKIIEKMQERRLHQWQRADDVAKQKSQDEHSITRYVRSRQRH